MSSEANADTVIAETKVVFVTDTGRKFPVTLGIGKPYLANQTACCVYYMDGYKKPFQAYGEDTFQALCGAIGMIRSHLNSLVEHSGYKIYEGDVDFESENYEENYAFSVELVFAMNL
ncbi:MAG: hypothetical protein EKK48_10535 [Candidatus Melainabacteria bacterium]|nr:MAG: hypothetical protein EKK48_10535 [Candidatus Melainabacteria bacterium]